MLPEISFPSLCLVLREQAASLAALSLLGMLGQFEQKVLAGCSSWKNPASAFKQMQDSELD